MEAIFLGIRYQPKFVYDADIKGAVRRDSHHGIPELIGRD
jgi:hypothetical protein